jgi:hypothetical protein
VAQVLLDGQEHNKILIKISNFLKSAPISEEYEEKIGAEEYLSFRCSCCIVLPDS